MKTIDTSPDCGISEDRIYKFMKQNPNKKFDIISKIKYFPKTNTISWLKNYLNSNSFKKLNNCNSLSILIHNETDILRSEVIRALNHVVKKKVIKC